MSPQERPGQGAWPPPDCELKKEGPGSSIPGNTLLSASEMGGIGVPGQAGSVEGGVRRCCPPRAVEHLSQCDAKGGGGQAGGSGGGGHARCPGLLFLLGQRDGLEGRGTGFFRPKLEPAPHSPHTVQSFRLQSRSCLCSSPWHTGVVPRVCPGNESDGSRCLAAGGEQGKGLHQRQSL